MLEANGDNTVKFCRKTSEYTSGNLVVVHGWMVYGGLGCQPLWGLGETAMALRTQTVGCGFSDNWWVAGPPYAVVPPWRYSVVSRFGPTQESGRLPPLANRYHAQS